MDKYSVLLHIEHLNLDQTIDILLNIPYLDLV